MTLLKSGGPRKRRSPAEWVLRGGLVALIAASGAAATCFTVAKVAVSHFPAWAHSISPRDGQVTAAYALALAKPDSDAPDYSLAKRLAREALRQDPTATGAADVLGLIAQSQGNSTEEQRYFSYSQRLSRRNLATQLWSIEDAVARDRIPDALRWYDATLRTSPEMSKLLFPPLVVASSEAAIRPQLIRTLATRPPWSGYFLRFIPNNAANPGDVIVLFDNMQRAGLTVPPQAASALIDRLLTEGKMDQAWNYYSRLYGKSERNRLRDPHFSAQTANSSLLDWRMVGTDGMSITMDSNALDFSIPAGASGAVVRQVQLLPAGTYVLSGHSEGIDLPPAARPYWTLTCGLGQGTELGRAIMPGILATDGTFSGGFTVPTTCPLQTLALIVQPTDADAGLTGRVDNIQLAPK